MPEDLNALEDQEFRMVVRNWVEANYPPELRNPPKRLHWAENKVWYMKLVPLHKGFDRLAFVRP